MTSPVSTSYKLAVLSQEAVTNCSAPGSQSAAATTPLWPISSFTGVLSVGESSRSSEPGMFPRERSARSSEDDWRFGRSQLTAACHTWAVLSPLAERIRSLMERWRQVYIFSTFEFGCVTFQKNKSPRGMKPHRVDGPTVTNVLQQTPSTLSGPDSGGMVCWCSGYHWLTAPADGDLPYPISVTRELLLHGAVHCRVLEAGDDLARLGLQLVRRLDFLSRQPAADWNGSLLDGLPRVAMKTVVCLQAWHKRDARLMNMCSKVWSTT